MMRRALVLLALLLAARPAAAQSIRFGPARIGGDPASVSTNTFPNIAGSFLQLQTGTCTIATNATSCTVTIASVSMTTSFLVYAGSTGNDSANTVEKDIARYEFTNGTTITCVRGNQASTGTLPCTVQVVTFLGGISVQHVACVQGSGTTCDSTISSVNLSRSVCMFLGETVLAGNAPVTVVGWTPTCTFTSTTNLHFVEAPTTVATLGAEVISFQ